MGATPPRRRLVADLLTVLALVALFWLLWVLRSLLILAFGAIVLAVVLRVIAQPLRRRLRLPDRAALLAAILIVTAVFAVAFWMFGQEVARQASTLRESVPAAWQAIQQRLDTWGLGEAVRQALPSLEGGGQSVVSSMTRMVVSFTSALADIVLVIFGAIYLAADPELYRRGVAKLVPERARPALLEALEDCYGALRLWLLGRVTTMLLVGTLTGVGLWAIGMQAPLALGVTAGILDFVPFVGPIVAAIPAILLALATSPTMALWVVLLYLAAQQLEGNVITPLIQKRAVELPPALLLFALVGFGLLFGAIGVLLAEPLTVVVYVLVKRLYVRGALQTPTSIPGEQATERQAPLA
ncbi:AI-2E family transporter [Sphingomonas parva]|uniref:AI-2E family transporter n=1 Tax=Sphingomonas parva TaxID=2555898 RepID=A0A4Y8ZNN0_9SPHN|nr:AI-2E family transporter [Sphingomonas parva]TFI57057.1 AI-2E family transporter [Sphingomonas parva]